MEHSLVYLLCSTFIIPNVLCIDDCIVYDFEKDFYTLFNSTTTQCGAYQHKWTWNNYNSIGIDPPDSQSTAFISPEKSKLTSCVPSFIFNMTNGGTIEVLVFTENILITEGIIITVRTVSGATIGSAINTLLVPSFLPGWITLKTSIALPSPGVFEGYIVFMGMESVNSKVLVDSFRYIPPSLHEKTCVVYNPETWTTILPTTILTTDLETTTDDNNVPISSVTESEILSTTVNYRNGTVSGHTMPETDYDTTPVTKPSTDGNGNVISWTKTTLSADSDVSSSTTVVTEDSNGKTTTWTNTDEDGGTTNPVTEPWSTTATFNTSISTEKSDVNFTESIFTTTTQPTTSETKPWTTIVTEKTTVNSGGDDGTTNPVTELWTTAVTTKTSLSTEKGNANVTESIVGTTASEIKPWTTTVTEDSDDNTSPSTWTTTNVGSDDGTTNPVTKPWTTTAATETSLSTEKGDAYATESITTTTQPTTSESKPWTTVVTEDNDEKTTIPSTWSTANAGEDDVTTNPATEPWTTRLTTETSLSTEKTDDDVAESIISTTTKPTIPESNPNFWVKMKLKLKLFMDVSVGIN